MACNILPGDATQLLTELPESSVDLLVTDPPYTTVPGGSTTLDGGIFGTEHAGTGRMFEHNDLPFTAWLPQAYRVMKTATHSYIMSSGRQLSELTGAALAAGFEFQNLLVWDKRSVTPNRYYMQQTEFILLLKKGPARTISDPGQSNIIRVPNEVGAKLHPTQKPVSLMKVFIQNSSNSGDLVLDPFVGSGATAIAAEQLGREFIGYDIDPLYIDIATKRLRINQPSLL